MNNNKSIKNKTFSEVNLKVFLAKILDYKWLFAISLPICLALAYVYGKIAAPTYEVHTSLLIETSGQTRSLGESKYVEGGVGLIGTEKNLYNEIGILKSYDLVDRTIGQLDFGISYFSGDWYNKREHYQYFPFEVQLKEGAAQLYGEAFKVEILSEKEYRLSIEAKEYVVSNPVNQSFRELKRPLGFSGTFAFEEEVVHDYFSFTIVFPDYPVELEEFADKPLTFTINRHDDLVNSYKEKLEVEQFDIQASILNLRTKGPVLKKEEIFLTTLSENFINGKFLERTEIAASKESFIRSQLMSVSDSLAIAERRLETFKRGAQAVDLTRSASNSLDQLQRLETEKGQMELNIKYYKSLLNYIGEANGIEKIVAPSVAGINDPLLNENLLELKRLNSEKTRLQYFKGKRSYDIQIIDEQLSNTTNALKENLRNLVRSSNIALSDKKQRIAQLEQTMKKLPGNEKQLLNYQRKSNLYENLYNYLSQELAKTGIARAEDIADTRVLDKARMVGDGPVAPQKALILILAFFVGLLIPLIWIIFSESFAEQIEGADQLEEFSDIPLAAKLGDARKVSALHIPSATNWKIEESFRDLAANLHFQHPSREENVIGISSIVPGEGKTYTAVNLALAMAREGKRVLLVDLNFRKPSVFKDDNAQRKKGMSEYLKDKAAADEIIYAYGEAPNLHYIPTHHESVNPHMLLSSVRLETLIKALKFEYDYILLDSPAVGLVSDYLLISRMIDIHLFVVRRGRSKLRFLSDIDRLIEKGKMKHSYLIFNGANSRTLKQGYAYPQYEAGSSVKQKWKSLPFQKKRV